MSQWCEVGACLLLGWFLGLVLGLVLGLEWGGLKPPPRSKHTLPRLPLWNKVVVVVPRSGAVVVGAPGGGAVSGGFAGRFRGGFAGRFAVVGFGFDFRRWKTTKIQIRIQIRKAHRRHEPDDASLSQSSSSPLTVVRSRRAGGRGARRPAPCSSSCSCLGGFWLVCFGWLVWVGWVGGRLGWLGWVGAWPGGCGCVSLCFGGVGVGVPGPEGQDGAPPNNDFGGNSQKPQDQAQPPPSITNPPTSPPPPGRR